MPTPPKRVSMRPASRGRTKKAENALRELAQTEDPRRVEGTVHSVGYNLLEAERLKPALKLLELNAEDTNAEEMIARIQGGGDENE